MTPIAQIAWSSTLILVMTGTTACAEQTDAEPEGATESNLQGTGQFQPRMRQALRLLRQSLADINAVAPTSSPEVLVNQAITDVLQGIHYDNTHISAKEDQVLDHNADVAVQSSLETCATEANPTDCLLQACSTTLHGATVDKGGYRVKAIAAIDQARAALPGIVPPPPPPPLLIPQPSEGGRSP